MCRFFNEIFLLPGAVHIKYDSCGYVNNWSSLLDVKREWLYCLKIPGQENFSIKINGNTTKH